MTFKQFVFDVYFVLTLDQIYLLLTGNILYWACSDVTAQHIMSGTFYIASKPRFPKNEDPRLHADCQFLDMCSVTI